jgi:LPS-assembly protein
MPERPRHRHLAQRAEFGSTSAAAPGGAAERQSSSASPTTTGGRTSRRRRSFIAAPAAGGACRPSGLASTAPRAREGSLCAVLQWQVLQDPQALIDEPYERSLQLGAPASGVPGRGLEYRWRPSSTASRCRRPPPAAARRWPTGDRGCTPWARWRGPGASRLVAGAAAVLQRRRLPHRAADERRPASQRLAGDPDLQRRQRPRVRAPQREVLRPHAAPDLEPRVLYVNTPYREQSTLPNFDAAGKDFNFDSIFSDNDFSGVDRVSDAHQHHRRLTSRLVDDSQRRRGCAWAWCSATCCATSASPPTACRRADAALVGCAAAGLDEPAAAAGCWTPRCSTAPTSRARCARCSARAGRRGRFAPSAATTGWCVAVEQAEWAGSGRWRGALQGGRGSGDRLQPRWYSVGRINYSLKDSRITDSIVGFEYDAGCWIGRIVAERAVHRPQRGDDAAAAAARAGGPVAHRANPLRVLKDNIPGYRLLREERGGPPRTRRPMTEFTPAISAPPRAGAGLAAAAAAGAPAQDRSGAAQRRLHRAVVNQELVTAARWSSVWRDARRGRAQWPAPAARAELRRWCSTR